jgi:trigger factor
VAITTEKLPRSLVSLEIEVEPDRVEASMSKAAEKISRQVRIPGFRPGKAPRHIVERHVGKGALLQEALELLIPDLYSEAIESEQIDAIDQPQFDLKSTEPLVLSATVPVRPSVDLKDYQSLRAPKPEATVTEEQVQETLTNLRRRYATLEPVDRPLQWNDTVRADVTVSVEGQLEPHVEEDAEFPVREGGVVSLPGFVERLIGLDRGGPYEVEFTLPEDFQAEELAGKSAHYTVTINEVKQEVLPDLDDDFARSLDEGFDDLASLEQRVREDLEQELERQSREGYHDEIVDLLVASAELDYPDVLVEREIDRMIDRESNHASHTEEGLQRWLDAVGRSLEDVREGLREAAELNVRRALALGELVEAEGVEVTEEQVEGEISSTVASLTGGEADEQRLQAIRGLIDTPEGRQSIRNQLITRGAIERLEAICALPLGAAEEPGSRRRGTRRRRGRAEGGEEGTAAADEGGAAAETEETPMAEERAEG